MIASNGGLDPTRFAREPSCAMNNDRQSPARSSIDFYFDFSSPYAYLAVDRVIALAECHGRAVCWHPILLGVVFRASGAQPLVEMPLKGDYLRRDCPRFARLLGLPFIMPDPFPFASVAAARAVYWAGEVSPIAQQAVVRGLLGAIFGNGIALVDKQAVADTVAGLGLPALPAGSEAVLAGIESPEIKDRLRTENEEAIAAGVFGSPFVIADGEPFWGADRLDHVDWWLSGCDLVNEEGPA
jgi:2-hydroxychromene-2-carboxylate isomerase